MHLVTHAGRLKPQPVVVAAGRGADSDSVTGSGMALPPRSGMGPFKWQTRTGCTACCHSASAGCWLAACFQQLLRYSGG